MILSLSIIKYSLIDDVQPTWNNMTYVLHFKGTYQTDQQRKIGALNQST